MKKILVIFITLLCCFPAFADHIRGGEMYYAYLGPGSTPNSSLYKVTLKLYVRCDANPGQLDNSEAFTVFTQSDNQQFGPVYNAPFVNEIRISYDPNSNPCISNPPTDICYRMRFYETNIELPDNPNGYIVALQRCCRIAGIANIAAPSDNYGATYSCAIPGTNALPLPEHNSSPVISGNDAVAICAGSYFTYDFSAKDPDNDSLVYSLCEAYQGGGRNAPAPNPASRPPFSPVPYQFPYSGSTPLGGRATINPSTGLISGIAPSFTAQYVVTACVSEYRHGKLINVHRKDIHLRIADCIPLKAMLKPDYFFCDNFLVTFRNEQVNPAGSVYIWQYGDGSKADTSSNTYGQVQHQYADTGTYTVKLKVILAGQCLDSTTTRAGVYPGFFPGFVATGSCLLNPIQFTDTTKSRYGMASRWRWNFGDETAQADTSRSQNPSWKYSTTGVKTVQLIVQSSKGCIDTVSRKVEVKDKPAIALAFRDTLICSNPPVQDTLQLQASGFGSFSWKPNMRISNSNTPNPLVYPTSTITYYVQLNENGCINNDSVRVRTIDHVTLNAGPDTTICQTDAVILRAGGNGLAYAWTPAASLDNPSRKTPVATPTATTTYTVTASIGKCRTQANVTITTVPYPGAFAGRDTTICYNDTAQLKGSIKGSSFSWSPVNTLLNPGSLTPLAHPLSSTAYVLTVYDNIGCPKPGRDTVLVTVRPKVVAFAGNDTAVVVNEPLKLFATGAEFYLWNPPDFLDRNNIQSPTALFNHSGIYTYTVKVYTREGCFGMDTISIKVFKTAPDIFVPNAFTPGTGLNAVFRPILVGISRIDYFRVYNRWGQLVFSTVEGGRGWDGTVTGKKQDAGTYVWVVQGRDFTGKVIAKKGTVILIR